jgi:hypothetical protein
MKMAMTSRRSDRRNREGFSLGEMLATLVISALMLTAVLGIYARTRRAADAVIAKIDAPALADETLQLIARDLDRMIGADGATIELRNGVDTGFSRAQLIIRQIFRDTQGNEQTLFRIVWQGTYDTEGGSTGLILYRSYEGVVPEDRLFEEKRKDLEKTYPFVPVCRGVTFFNIQALSEDGAYVDQWSNQTLPTGVRVSLSLATPYESAKGIWTVADEEKQVRTVAIDRTRTPKLDLNDANQPQAANAGNTSKPSEPNAPRSVRR